MLPVKEPRAEHPPDPFARQRDVLAFGALAVRPWHPALRFPALREPCVAILTYQLSRQPGTGPLGPGTSFGCRPSPAVAQLKPASAVDMKCPVASGCHAVPNCIAIPTGTGHVARYARDTSAQRWATPRRRHWLRCLKLTSWSLVAACCANRRRTGMTYLAGRHALVAALTRSLVGCAARSDGRGFWIASRGIPWGH